MELTNRCARVFLGALTLGAVLAPASAAADEPTFGEATPTTEPCPPPQATCEPCFSLDPEDCQPEPCPPPQATCEPCLSLDPDDCAPDPCPPDGCVACFVDDPDCPGDPGDDPGDDPDDPGDDPGGHVDEPHDPSVPADPTFTG